MNNFKQLVLLLLCHFIGSIAKSQGIKFEKSLNWEQIQTKARSENKYIFMDSYATWCGPCKEMNTDVFPNNEVGDFINGKFISVKVQMDQTKDDDESVRSWYTDAKSIAQQYRVTAYPTILFFSPNGKVVGRSVGYKDAVLLITEARKAIANTEEFRSLYDQYNSGKSDSVLLKRLAVVAREIGETELAENISQQYIGSLNNRELFKKDNLQFVNQFTISSNNVGFKLFRNESKKVNSVLGVNAAEKKVRDIVINEEIAPFVNNKAHVPDWIAIEDKVNTKYGSLGLEAYYGERMAYAANIKDWLISGKYYALYYTTAYSRSKFHINNISWAIFEEINDPKVLDVAAKTMKYDIEHFDQNDAGSYDTYANLLYKIGKKDEAILWESKAVQLEEENATKGNRKPNSVFAETLEKMKKGIPTWFLEKPKK